MYVLGINSIYHESSACLLQNGVMVAMAEEERFNRVKHGKEARADNPHELPLQAIAFCLRAAGIEPKQVAHITVAADPDEMAAVYRDHRPSAWQLRENQALFLQNLPKVPQRLAELGFTGQFHWVGHHTAHAASSFYVSGFDQAAVLVVDALGDDAYSCRSYSGNGLALEALHSVRYPASLGYLWELISVFLGFGVYDAAKVMGLAAYGDPRRFAAGFDRLVWSLPDGGFEMAHDLLRFAEILYYPPSAYFAGIEEVFGLKPRQRGEELVDHHHDLAAALQAKTNEVVLEMTRHLQAVTGARRLCLAGGVALNCVTNEYVFSQSPWEELFIQPAAHDAGLAIGAAYFVWHQILGQPRAAAMPHAYWGPSFSEDAIESELRRHEGLQFAKTANLEQEVARLIAEGQVVGFFQGAMEMGPRALGNRSILADPRYRHMREVLNHKVKHREYFRPLAPSVLAEAADEFFEISKKTSASDYMLMAYRTKPEKRALIEAVLHVDDTCRVQTVSREVNPRFHRVISAFRDLTGVPMVLNTSFNDQEPIICTPSDAVATFTKTEIDYLAIGDFLVHKRVPQLEPHG